MRKILVILFLLIIASSSFAQELSEGIVKAIKADIMDTFDAEILNIKEMDIPNLYELETEEAILYYHLPTKTIFIGALIRNKVNLTEKTMQEKTAKFIEEAEKEAILVKKGKNKVLLITDPDCPFCKKVDNFLKNKDVELKVILYPLKQLHPHAEKKVAYIFDSKDKEKAYKEVMEGKVDISKIGEDLLERQRPNLMRHEELVKKLKVRGTPALWVNGERIDGADMEAIERNLK